VQAAAGFFTYFYILNDYGLRPISTFNLALVPGYIPEPTDVYDPNKLNYGNSNYMDEKFQTPLNWNGVKHFGIDYRLFYTSITPDAWAKCRWNDENPGLPFYRTSWYSGVQVCYTTEALRYAQGGYLVSIVCVQWADLMICKTRCLSIAQQGMVNRQANIALFFETALVALMCYIPWLNIIFTTRQNAFPHFAVPSFSFYCVIMAYDELRKIYVRRGIKKNKRNRAKYTGWIARNTYY